MNFQTILLLCNLNVFFANVIRTKSADTAVAGGK
jgi:hypothetical protein